MSDARAEQRPSRHPKPAKTTGADAGHRQGPSRRRGRQGARPQPAEGEADGTRSERPTFARPRSRRSARPRTTAAARPRAARPRRSSPASRVVLIGHNGSGKTTMLRMVSGLLEPSDGSVTLVHGHPAGSIDGTRRGQLPGRQPDVLRGPLASGSTWSTSPRMHGMRDWEQQAADLLGHLGLYERADDLPSQFSRGLRQKASIAIGFIRPFGLLLVDEPFVGLDASGKAALLDLLDEAHGDGATRRRGDPRARVRAIGSQRCVALRDGSAHPRRRRPPASTCSRSSPDSARRRRHSPWSMPGSRTRSLTRHDPVGGSPPGCA